MAEWYRTEAPVGVPQAVALIAAAFGVAIVAGVGVSAFGGTQAAAFAKLGVGPVIVVAMWQVVVRARVGRPRLVGLVAAAAVGLAYFTSYYLDFADERNEAVDVVLYERDDRLARGWSEAKTNDLLVREWESVTFLRHMRRRTGFARGHELWGSPHRLGTSMDGVFEVLSIILALLIAVTWTRRRAAHPCCRVCGRWSKPRVVARLRHGTSRRLVTRLLRDRDVGPLLLPPDTREHIEIVRWQCPAGHESEHAVIEIADVEYKRSRVLVRRPRASLRISAETFEPLTGDSIAAAAEPS